jgi:hypothetical protein
MILLVSSLQNLTRVPGLVTYHDVRCPETVEELQELINSVGLASEVDVLLLCPLNPILPAFVLAVFPQLHQPDANVYLARWTTAEYHLQQRGLFIVSHAADGAAPHLRAQKARQPYSILSASSATPPASLLATRDKLLWFEVPSLWQPRAGEAPNVVKVTAPARIVTVAGRTSILLPDLHFQDFCHLGAKLRMRVCGRNMHGVTIGNGRADISLLSNELGSRLWKQMLINIRKDDFDPRRDPMNVPAFFRLTSATTLSFLRLCQDDERSSASAPSSAARGRSIPASHLEVSKMTVKTLRYSCSFSSNTY